MVLKYVKVFSHYNYEMKVSNIPAVFGPWGDNSHRLGYEMCHFLRVLFWLKNKFLGLFYSF